MRNISRSNWRKAYTRKHFSLQHLLMERLPITHTQQNKYLSVSSSPYISLIYHFRQRQINWMFCLYIQHDKTASFDTNSAQFDAPNIQLQMKGQRAHPFLCMYRRQNCNTSFVVLLLKCYFLNLPHPRGLFRLSTYNKTYKYVMLNVLVPITGDKIINNSEKTISRR